MVNRSKARVNCCVSALVLGVVTLLAPIRHAAAAPSFAQRGSLALGAEDVTGYYARSLKYWDRNDRTVELSRSNFSVALATGGVRLGLHFFLLQGLSLGGTVGFEFVSGSNTYQDNPGTWSTDVPTNSRIVLAPKIGYALMFSDEVGLWFRGGPSYERQKQRNSEGNNSDYSRDSLLLVSADILFVWSPFPCFGLLVGPTGDRSLIGRHFEHNGQNGDYSNDARLWRLGLTTGIIGYF